MEWQLPNEVSHIFEGDTYDPSDLIGFLRQFRWFIPSWFRTAFNESIKFRNENSAFFVRCIAIVDPESIDEVLEFCVTALVKVSDKSEEEQEWDRKARQGEIDAVHESVYEGGYEEWLRVESAVEAAVAVKHSEDGYEWIPEHSRCDLLIHSWSKLLGSESPDNEIEAFVGSSSEHSQLDIAFDSFRDLRSDFVSEWFAKQLFTTNRILPESWKGVFWQNWTSEVFATSLRQHAESASFPERASAAYELISLRPNCIHS